MNVAIFIERYTSFKMSGSYMMQDLAHYFSSKNHNVHIFTSNDQNKNKNIVKINNVTIYSLKSFKFRQSNKILRFFQELFFPLLLLFRFSNELKTSNLQIGIYYSPPIFWSPIMIYLKKKNRVINYLVLRDLFPKWLVDLKIIKNNSLQNKTLKFFEKKLYKNSDLIGVQSPKNINYFDDYYQNYKHKVRLLYNWINPINLNLNENYLLDRKKQNIVYVGNLGIAQNINFLKSLLKHLSKKKDLNFSFFSSGSHLNELKSFVLRNEFENVIFIDPIPNEKLIYQISIADLGIVSLSSDFRTHNIPGKFLSYLIAGIPVGCSVNLNNDLFEIVNKYDVGFCENSENISSFTSKLDCFLFNIKDKKYKKNCDKLVNDLFSTHKAYLEILSNV